jgi:glutaredoxin
MRRQAALSSVVRLRARATSLSLVAALSALSSLSPLAVATLGASTAGCQRKSEAATEAAPESPVLNDTTTGLLLTWVDDKGEFHTEQRTADVPPEGREMVRVRDPARDPLSGDRVFVADLRSTAIDGNYRVRVVPGRQFEQLAVTARTKRGGVLSPRAAASAGAPGAQGAAGAGDVAGVSVIIYGASWCGPCHQAAEYLTKRGVKFVLHDIEKDSSAQREMQAKLAKAGARGGSIPVLDVRGRILIGFDARAVDEALGQPL